MSALPREQIAPAVAQDDACDCRLAAHYALRKNLWAFTADRIAVRFQYEWHDDTGQCWRSYGNENWEFDAQGYMSRNE